MVEIRECIVMFWKWSMFGGDPPIISININPSYEDYMKLKSLIYQVYESDPSQAMQDVLAREIEITWVETRSKTCVDEDWMWSQSSSGYGEYVSKERKYEERIGHSKKITLRQYLEDWNEKVNSVTNRDQFISRIRSQYDQIISILVDAINMSVREKHAVIEPLGTFAYRDVLCESFEGVNPSNARDYPLSVLDFLDTFISDCKIEIANKDDYLKKIGELKTYLTKERKEVSKADGGLVEVIEYLREYELTADCWVESDKNLKGLKFEECFKEIGYIFYNLCTRIVKEYNEKISKEKLISYNLIKEKSLDLGCNDKLNVVLEIDHNLIGFLSPSDIEKIQQYMGQARELVQIFSRIEENYTSLTIADADSAASTTNSEASVGCAP